MMTNIELKELCSEIKAIHARTEDGFKKLDALLDEATSSLSELREVESKTSERKIYFSKLKLNKEGKS